MKKSSFFLLIALSVFLIPTACEKEDGTFRDNGRSVSLKMINNSDQDVHMWIASDDNPGSCTSDNVVKKSSFMWDHATDQGFTTPNQIVTVGINGQIVATKNTWLVDVNILYAIWDGNKIQFYTKYTNAKKC